MTDTDVLAEHHRRFCHLVKEDAEEFWALNPDGAKRHWLTQCYADANALATYFPDNDEREAMLNRLEQDFARLDAGFEAISRALPRFPPTWFVRPRSGPSR